MEKEVFSIYCNHNREDILDNIKNYNKRLIHRNNDLLFYLNIFRLYIKKNIFTKDIANDNKFNDIYQYFCGNNLYLDERLLSKAIKYLRLKYDFGENNSLIKDNYKNYIDKKMLGHKILIKEINYNDPKILEVYNLNTKIMKKNLDILLKIEELSYFLEEDALSILYDNIKFILCQNEKYIDEDWFTGENKKKLLISIKDCSESYFYDLNEEGGCLSFAGQFFWCCFLQEFFSTMKESDLITPYDNLSEYDIFLLSEEKQTEFYDMFFDNFIIFKKNSLKSIYEYPSDSSFDSDDEKDSVSSEDYHIDYQTKKKLLEHRAKKEKESLQIGDLDSYDSDDEENLSNSEGENNEDEGNSDYCYTYLQYEEDIAWRKINSVKERQIHLIMLLCEKRAKKTLLLMESSDNIRDLNKEIVDNCKKEEMLLDEIMM